MDFKQIQDLIKLVGKSNLSELKIEEGDFRITLRTKDYGARTEVVQVAQAPAAAPAPAPAAPAPAPAAEAPKAEAPKQEDTAADDADNGKYITVKSPMIGTFYRSPGPDKDPFVKVGDNIDQGTVICIIEAMKLFNEIESEQKGKIVKVLIDDASPVEYDQPLFIIDPS